MPVSPKYPGVYLEEIPSGVRTIVGVSTATTAFVGRARKGPVNEVRVIHSFVEYDRIFGGLWGQAPMSIAVHQYFANGGEAVIVRVAKNAKTVTFTANGNPAPDLVLEASSPGAWAADLQVDIDHLTGPTTTSDPLINITVRNGTDPTPLETIRNVSFRSDSPSFIVTVLEQTSQYLRVSAPASFNVTNVSDGIAATATVTNADGDPLDSADIVPASPTPRAGIHALDTADIFNLLCLPPPAPGGKIGATEYQSAASYCHKRRAILLVDPPPSITGPTAVIGTVAGDIQALVGADDKKNAAAFYPFVTMQDPLNPALTANYPPSGAVAGVFARTDVQRGVWKAPAGIDASITGALGLSVALNDDDNGVINADGINCLRTFPLTGTIVWGGRTMDGADRLASEWKYIPVRRTALYIEESLYRGLKWVVFEPNDEPLWSQIRLNVGAFMNNLFRQGAFQGAAPRDAYFVKCDRDTTTQTDINLGIVNVLVGFAPLKPAEFVIIKIQQMAGQVAA